MATRKGFVYDISSKGFPFNVAPEDSGYEFVEDVTTLEDGSFQDVVTGLITNTTYFYRSFGFDGVDYTYGTETSFTTDDIITLNFADSFSLVELNSNKPIKTFDESFMLSEVKGIGVTKLIFDSVDVVIDDSVTQEVELDVHEDACLSEVPYFSMIKNLIDSFEISDSLLKTFSLVLNLNENLTLSDIKSFFLEKELFDSSILSDSKSLSALKQLSENLTITESYDSLFIVILALSDTINLADAKLNSISKNLVDTTEINDILSKSATLKKQFAELVNSIDRLQKVTTKVFTDEFNVTDTRTNVFLLELLDNLGISDFLVSVQSYGLIFHELIQLKDRTCMNRISGVIDSIQKDFENVLYDLQGQEEAFALDLENVLLRDIMNEKVNLVKTITIKEGSFIEDIEKLEFCIDCRINPISQKDRNMIPLGQITTGSMIGYFLPSYIHDDDSYEVEENDEINDSKNNVRYRVTKIIQREHLNTKVIYIKAFLQKI